MMLIDISFFRFFGALVGFIDNRVIGKKLHRKRGDMLRKVTCRDVDCCLCTWGLSSHHFHQINLTESQRRLTGTFLSDDLENVGVLGPERQQEEE